MKHLKSKTKAKAYCQVSAAQNGQQKIGQHLKPKANGRKKIGRSPTPHLSAVEKGRSPICNGGQPQDVVKIARKKIRNRGRGRPGFEAAPTAVGATCSEAAHVAPAVTAGAAPSEAVTAGPSAGLGQGSPQNIARSRKRIMALEQVPNDDIFVSECAKENIDVPKIKKLRLEAEFLNCLLLESLEKEAENKLETRFFSELVAPSPSAKNVVEKPNNSRSPPSTSAMAEPRPSTSARSSRYNRYDKIKSEFNARKKMAEERKLVAKTKEKKSKVSKSKIKNVKTKINLPATPEYEPAYPKYAPVTPTEYYPELIKYFPSSPTKYSPLTPDNSPKNLENSPKNLESSPKNVESSEDSDSSDSEDEVDWSLSALSKRYL